MSNCKLLWFGAFSTLALSVSAWNGSQKTLVPAYFYPGPLWDQMISAGAGIIIANPDSGPGSSYDSNYGNYINKTRKASINTIGYVYTSYGARSLSAVKADIQSYLKWYKINGIFFDEVAADSAHVTYYNTLATYVRGLNSAYLVVLNPGTIPSVKNYLDFANVVVINEDNVSTSSTFKIPSWMCSYDASRICLMYHTASDATVMKKAVTRGKSLNAGYMYITNDVMPNPYDKLPSYYQKEVAALASTVSGLTCTGN